jgi:hypothetical protein
LLVVGGKGDGQESLLAAGLDPIADVQKRVTERVVAAEDADRAALLDHEQHPLGTGRVADVDRPVELAQLAQLDAAGAVADLQLGGGGRREGGDEGKGDRDDECAHDSPNTSGRASLAHRGSRRYTGPSRDTAYTRPALSSPNELS